HTCAVGGDGAVWCWGRGTSEQLGDGGAVDQPLPVRAALSSEQGTPLGATAVTAGQDHTCALTGDGEVWCWGRGDAGQLGGAMVASGAPARVALPSAATAIAAGDAHSCALGADGVVRCWGANDQGQLGSGAAGTDVATPVQALTGADRVVTGARHTCARRSDGSLWCWGANGAGQLGDGVTLQRNV